MQAVLELQRYLISDDTKDDLGIFFAKGPKTSAQLEWRNGARILLYSTMHDRGGLVRIGAVLTAPRCQDYILTTTMPRLSIRL